jgi:hypothetical protein
MPQIIIQADDTEGTVTLAERVVPVDRQNAHYRNQLIERLGWAFTDAEQLEGRVPDSRADNRGEGRTARRGRRTVLGPRYRRVTRTAPAAPR